MPTIFDEWIGIVTANMLHLDSRLKTRDSTLHRGHGKNQITSPSARKYATFSHFHAKMKNNIRCSKVWDRIVYIDMRGGGYVAPFVCHTYTHCITMHGRWLTQGAIMCSRFVIMCHTIARTMNILAEHSTTWWSGHCLRKHVAHTRRRGRCPLLVLFNAP